MPVSPDGVRFIATHEGRHNRPYQDSLGHCTVGVGHLIHTGRCTPEELGWIFTDEEVDALLAADLAWVERCLDTHVHVVLAQAQYDALASFVFNWGCGSVSGFPATSICRAVNKGRHEDVPAELVDGRGPPTEEFPDGRRYDKWLLGVRKRRQAEAALYGGAMKHPLATSYRQARWYTATNGRELDLVVLHSAETGEFPTTAEAVANYFATTDTKASAHFQCDNDSIVQSVTVNDVAWAAPGANHNGIHIEHAGRARQTRDEWLDAYSKVMLRDISAPLTRALCAEHGIPPVFVDAAGLKRGERGITTHVECSRAFGGDHWDPGPEFPMDLYLEWVRYSEEATWMAQLDEREMAALKDFLKADPAKVARVILGAANESAGALAVWANLDADHQRLEGELADIKAALAELAAAVEAATDAAETPGP